MREFAGSTVSRGRMVLVWLVDLWFFLTAFTALNFFFSITDTPALWTLLALFLVLKLLFVRFNTPGMYALSVNWLTREVDREVKLKESWLSILLGLLLLFSGLGFMVQWMTHYQPLAWFGFTPNMPAQVFLQSLTGLATVLAGFWYLKTQMRGIVLAAGLNIAWIISIILSTTWWQQQLAALPSEAFGNMDATRLQQLVEGFPFAVAGVHGVFLVLMLFTIGCFKPIPK